MSKVVYEYVEEHIRSLIPKNDELLSSMREYANINHIPIVEEETEKFIKFVIEIKRPKKVLELGTAIGYSAISFTENSTVENFKTVEIREDMVKIARENIKNKNLEDKIEIINMDAYEFLLSMQDEKFDMIFIDAAKGQYEKYFNLAVNHLNKSGIIICDNVLFRGMISNQDLVVRRKITIVKRLRKFLKYISESDIYTSSIVPIGDGVILIKRKDDGEN